MLDLRVLRFEVRVHVGFEVEGDDASFDGGIKAGLDVGFDVRKDVSFEVGIDVGFNVGMLRGFYGKLEVGCKVGFDGGLNVGPLDGGESRLTMERIARMSSTMDWKKDFGVGGHVLNEGLGASGTKEIDDGLVDGVGL
jgi:hypothetical protein